MQLTRQGIASYDFIAFKECNNNCTFCFQKNTENTKFIDQADVIRRYDVLMDYILNNSDNVSEINIDMTGGELFFKPGLEKMYETIIDRTKNTKDILGKRIRLLLGTNLLYNDTSVLYHTIDYILKVDKDLLRGVFTSFDIIGRFRTEDKIEIHKKNTKDLFDYLYPKKIPLAIVSVLSKESMIHFMRPETILDKLFVKTYNEYYNLAKSVVEPSKGLWWLRLSWTALSPNTISSEYTDEMVPSSDDYVVFYKFLVDNYNTMAIIHSFYENKRSLRCGNNCHVCKTDIIEKSCDSNIYGNEILIPENLHVSNNDPNEIYKYLIKKFGCLTCKYLSKCYIRPCPVVLNLKTVERGNFCWRKKIYEYVETKK